MVVVHNRLKSFIKENYDYYNYYWELKIKIFGLVLEFEMSFQQQQHRIAFILPYQWTRSSLRCIFLTRGHSSNLIGPNKELLRLLGNFYQKSVSINWLLDGLRSKQIMPMLKLKEFWKNLRNKIFCRMYSLAMIEVMSLSGHLLHIVDIKSRWNTFFYSIHLMMWLFLSQVINWDFYIFFQVIQAVEDFVLETRFKKVILAENICFKNSDKIIIRNLEAFCLENLDEFGILSEFVKNFWRMLLTYALSF